MPGPMDLQTVAVLAILDQFSYNPGGMPLPGQQMPTGFAANDSLFLCEGRAA